MLKNLNILSYYASSSQGNLQESVLAIKNTNIKVSKKIVPTLDDEVEIPYFLLPKSVEENQKSIYKALQEIVAPIVENLDAKKRAKTVLIIGTSLVDLNITDAIDSTVYDYKKTPYYSKKTSIDTYAKELTEEFGLNGYTMTISTACTSSVNALLEASNLIHSGIYDYAVVIGVEIYSKMMSKGFSSMKLLASGEQKPFDKARDGLILGEAVAGVLVGEEKSPWSLRGGYSNCNSSTITSVGPTGDEFREVMQNAMKIADVKLHDIVALKAHATSTLTNDLSEINAIKQVFDKDFKFTALKPYLGHTLGACGILELAIFMSCIDDGFIPKTINHEESIIDDYVPILEHVTCNSGRFMLNYFGFGGNNTSIVINKEMN